MLQQAVDFVLNLGPQVMLPIILTIFGLIFRQGFSKSFTAGVTVGVGFVGIFLVIDLLFSSLGPAAEAFVQRTGVDLPIIDVGWPIGAAISFGTQVAPLLIPLVLAVNIALLAMNWTKTMDVDLWNYWHFIFAASVMYYATNNLLLALAVGVITAVIVLKLADWTAPVIEHHFELPGVSLPHTETVNWAPLMYALNRVEERIPGFRDLNVSPEKLTERFGVFGQPMMLGLVLGLLIAVGAGLPLAQILTVGIETAALLTLLPRMVSLLMEGLVPLSEGVRDFIQSRFPGKDVYIGLDAAIVIGHPAGMATALVMVPIVIFMAVLLPYNRMLPLADLAVLPFVVIWPVAVSRGNIVRGLVNGIITMCFIFFFATQFAALATEMGREVGFNFPAEAQGSPISGIDLGAHILPWLIINILQPGQPYFWVAVVGAVLYGLTWWWVRNDIRHQYAAEIAEAEEARAEEKAEAEAEERTGAG
ncbi:PTS galactitol transporter subunit IIC [soil metagenome]